MRDFSIEDPEASACNNLAAPPDYGGTSVKNRDISGFWAAPVVIARNNFKFKSLSNWALNFAVGCTHACRFCYVPAVSAIKLGTKLNPFGVGDPDLEWGNYTFIRKWDEQVFLRSLAKAESTPLTSLPRDGNRAVMLSSTTDPYQVIRNTDKSIQHRLETHARYVVRRSLELIRDRSSLNVRILTRSPLAQRDFDLFRSFGNRLLFGMSVPTLRNDLAKVYEPRAPAPGQRLRALEAAKAAGLNVFVAMAPTYPECDEQDLRNTLSTLSHFDPVTIFHEPINIRAENVQRIESHARKLGVTLQSHVFATPSMWREYAVASLKTVERLALDIGVQQHLHLWPDSSLGSKKCLEQIGDPEFRTWLEKWWNRVSEWPGTDVMQVEQKNADPEHKRNSVNSATTIQRSRAAMKAWITIRAKYTDEELRSRATAAGKKAAQARRKRIAADVAPAPNGNH